jgi:hypothetical protein
MLASFAVTMLLAAAPAAGDAQPAADSHEASASSGTACSTCPWHAAKSAAAETRRDNPHSTVTGNDDAPVPPVDADRVAAEAEAAITLDFSKTDSAPIDDAQWEALEAENPNSVQSASRVAVAATTPAFQCHCLVSDARQPGRR